MAQTRREFLVQTGCGALSASALLSGLGRFALIDALAQSQSTTYRALVCVFLFGGNDSNNMVIPYTNYDAYNAARQRDDNTQTKTYAEFQIPQNDLLQINPQSAGLTFGLNPRLGDGSPDTTNYSMFDLWNQGRAAVVCNVGPLIHPISRDDYLHGLYRPYQLFSHSDQQNLWQTSYANGPKQLGWGGATVDKIGTSGNFPVVTSIAGVTVFSTGINTRPLVLAPGTPLNQSLRLFRSGTSPSEDEIRQVLMTDEGQVMPALIQGAAQISQSALDASDLLQMEPVINTVFPGSSLGNQLKQVAKLIKLAPAFGLMRQVFFVSIGGFDTHTGQGKYNPLPGPVTTGGQLGLLQQLSQAVGSFYQATVELGVSQQVTLFTSSDFSRTLLPGGGNTGTDHAWGSHQFVVGGAVNGQDFYGQFPSLATGTDQDTDGGGNPRGRWIPTTSVDQYALTLANWYGLTNTGDQNAVFPNIGNFDPNRTLGFMNLGAAPQRGTSRTTAARKG